MLHPFLLAVVGWVRADHMHTELGVDALQIAIWQRRPLSDGVRDIELGQYTSVAFTAELVDAGIAGSIATVGGALDNALCESAMGLFITEAYRPGPAAWQWLLCSAVGACRSGGRSASHVRSATAAESWSGPVRGPPRASGAP